MAQGYGGVAESVRAARHDPDLVVLEGVHALKHAVRFGARVRLACTPDLAALTRLLADLAPDVALPAHTVEVDAATWSAVTAGGRLPSPCVALAVRPPSDGPHVLRAAGRIVLLERPRHPGNVGAAIRVSAAAGAGGVLVLGGVDPWHPACVRGAAGLHFALPVARVDALDVPTRPLVALDPDGSPIGETAVGADAILAFGGERHGLSPELRAMATARLAIPMRPGVSSLNLATAVAVTLYAT
jgi:RNA methyltransferase, TrmH family